VLFVVSPRSQGGGDASPLCSGLEISSGTEGNAASAAGIKARRA